MNQKQANESPAQQDHLYYQKHGNCRAYPSLSQPKANQDKICRYTNKGSLSGYNLKMSATHCQQAGEKKKAEKGIPNL
jgi:hypothetical protein